MSEDDYTITFLRLKTPQDLPLIDARIKALGEEPPSTCRGALIYRRIFGTSGPEGLRLPPAMQQSAETSSPWPGHDIVIAARSNQADRLIDALDLTNRIDRRDSYTAHRAIVLDKGTIVEGTPSEGISYLYGLYFHDDRKRELIPT